MAKDKTTRAPAQSVGDGLIEAFEEIAAHLRGEVKMEGYDFVPPPELTPARIRQIRETVAGTRKGFEALTGIPSRTIEGYELGRRAPDAATRALLKVIEREPEAVRRALIADGEAA
ncbi:helix-turn-helix domain-containing protein [Xanthobacteraceae bacterium A53D]